MTKQITTKLTLFIFLIALTSATIKPFLVHATASPVLITEVQTGFTHPDGTEYPRFEYIEIANISGEAVEMAGWKLEYLSAANDGSTSGLVIATINNQIAPGGHGIWVHDGYFPGAFDYSFGADDTSTSGYLAKSGGHVRLMNGTIMVDCVAWGSAVVINGCDKVNSLAAPGYTIQRKPTNGMYEKLTGVTNLIVTPQDGGLSDLPQLPEEPQIKKCETVELSEILANPKGDDAPNEFIELYNPSDQAQSLYGCTLKLGSGKQYDFPADATMGAHEYRAFKYELTNLQLSNSGTSVILITTYGETHVSYPAVGDDEAWANINTIWQSTMQPTPNAPNVLEAHNETSAEILLASLEPCPIGKFRNPETGRCKNIVEVATTVTCSADQEKNPETGRCRKKTVATTTASCPAGQEKNLVTNRCRKIEVASSAKPCEVGQERNPDTGRCRKVVTKSAGKVLGETVSKKTYHYLVVAVFLLIILVYAVYEYRYDLLNFVNKFKKRFFTIQR